MTEINRFKKMRSFQDIKLEKAKLRYEMLLAEKNLVKSLNYTSGLFTVGAIMSRFNRGLNTALKTYSFITGFLGRKKKQYRNEQIDE